MSRSMNVEGPLSEIVNQSSYEKITVVVRLAR